MTILKMQAKRLKTSWMMLAALIALALAGCGSSSDADLSGNWTGTVKTIVGTVVTPSTAKASLSKNGTIITGNITLDSAAGSSAGTLAGTFNGSTLSTNFSAIDATKCPYSATLTYTDNKLTGIGTSYNCSVNASIEIELKR